MRASGANRATGVATVAAALAVVAVLAVARPSGAQSEPPATSITVLAGVPDEHIDVLVDGEALAGGLGYREVSEPVAVEPGRHEVAVRPRDTGLDAARLVVQLDEGDQVTVARFLDRTGEPQVDAFSEDRSPVPAGQARLVVRHLAELPAADVRVGGEALVAGLRSGRDA